MDFELPQDLLDLLATQAGIALMPMSLCWTLSSILGTRLLLQMGYRSLIWFGMVMLVSGAFLMSLIGPQASQLSVMVFTGMMGVGMGLSIPAFLIAVQSTVRKQELGAATSTLQFGRSIGGTLGVSILGAILSAQLVSHLLSAGIDPASISLNSLLDPVASSTASVMMEGPLRDALAVSIASLFRVAFLVALAGLLVTFFLPGGKISQLKPARVVDPPPGD